MLKLLDKLMSLGGILDGYKTLVGAGLVLVSQLGHVIPGFPAGQILTSVNMVGEVLFSLGVIHWKIKDIVR